MRRWGGLLRGYRPLCRLTHSPGLPQMTPLVCGDDVQSRRKAEPDSTNEWIREAHSREIDIGVRPKKRPYLILRGKEHRDCVVECWRVPRPDGARRLRLEAGFHRWFEKLHEPAADETRLCGT